MKKRSDRRKHCDSEINGDFRRKSSIFPTCVFNAPDEGFPLELGIGAGVRRNYNATRWSKKF